MKKCSAAVTSMKNDEDIEGCKELMCCIQYNMNYLFIKLKLSFTVQALCGLSDRMNNCTIQVKDMYYKLSTFLIRGGLFCGFFVGTV